MQIFSKEQNQLVNIYVCIHKISYTFFYNFVHAIQKIPFIYALSKKIYACIHIKRKQK